MDVTPVMIVSKTSYHTIDTPYSVGPTQLKADQIVLNYKVIHGGQQKANHVVLNHKECFKVETMRLI